MSVTGRMLEEAADEAEKYRAALERLLSAAETFASADADMPSYKSDEKEFDAAVEAAKEALGK